MDSGLRAGRRLRLWRIFLHAASIASIDMIKFSDRWKHIRA
jgi:hypothetical protein